MTDESKAVSSEDYVPEELHQARRDRWATTLACIATLLHVCAAFIVFVWFYWIAPRYKWELDQLGKQLSPTVIMQINLSDLFVNYWYLFGVFFLPVPFVSFLTHRWMARQLGLRCACASAIVVAVLIISNAVVGYTILRQALPFDFVYTDDFGMSN